MFCKLIVCANNWIKESDWKDLALLKLCLGALGAILGLTALRRNRKVSLVISAALFAVTWLPLMKRFFAVVCRTFRAGKPGQEEDEPEEEAPACGEDFSCDLDLA